MLSQVIAASTAATVAAPTALVWALFAVVVVIIAVSFWIFWLNVSAPRVAARLLRNVAISELVAKNDGAAELLKESGKVAKRVTRTTLALTGFALLGLLVVAVFGFDYAGLADLRNTVAGGVLTLVAAISGYYFGARNNDPSDSPAPKPDAKGTGSPADTTGPDSSSDAPKTGEAGGKAILAESPPPASGASAPAATKAPADRGAADVLPEGPAGAVASASASGHSPASDATPAVVSPLPTDETRAAKAEPHQH